MAAPTVASLYNFETNYESALADYFANVNAAWQILTPQTLANAALGTDILRTPRITIEFAVTGTGIQKEFTAGVNYHGTEYYADRMGMVTLSIVTQRANVSQSYGLMRGAARQSMLELTQTFNTNTVPYYQTVDVTEGSSAQSPSADNDEILTALTFPLTFFILPTAFP